MFDPDRAKELLAAFQEIGLRDVLTLESAGLVATLLDNHYDAVAILSKDPKMLYVNKNFEKTVGLKKRGCCRQACKGTGQKKDISGRSVARGAQAQKAVHHCAQT
ncbi:MAG: hypothetical protein ACUVSK_07945 [Desulfotomaculales bacterium]